MANACLKKAQLLRKFFCFGQVFLFRNCKNKTRFPSNSTKSRKPILSSVFHGKNIAKKEQVFYYSQIMFVHPTLFFLEWLTN